MRRSPGGGALAQGDPAEAHQPHFGAWIVSCERADLRPIADGVRIYSDDGVRDLTLPPSRGLGGRDKVLDELYAAAVEGIALLHDGRFGRGTVATVLAILESARTRREVAVG